MKITLNLALTVVLFQSPPFYNFVCSSDSSLHRKTGGSLGIRGLRADGVEGAGYPTWLMVWLPFLAFSH